MKTNSLIVFSLLFYISSFAQSYKHCLDGEMIRWSCLDMRDCDGGVTSQDIIAYGDTLFNGIMYKKLFRDFSFDSYEAEESNMKWINHVSSLNWIWDGYFIRESEDASKLYIYHPYYSEEFLISDLDLQEGDSVLLFTDFLGICETFVDSIYYVNDLKHIALHFYTSNHSKETVTFIESVGNDRWFIYPPNCNPNYVYLNCFLNQTIFYKNAKSSDFGSYDMLPCGCFSGFGKINSISEDNYKIFIDKNKIEIVFDTEMNIDISIYDMEGKLCYSGKNLLDKKIIIPLLSKGIYILNVFDIRHNRSITKKFIIP